MNFLAENWLYIVALVLFVAMHLLGFGCGGRHHSRRRPEVNTATEIPTELADGGSLPKGEGKPKDPGIRSWV